MLMTAANRVAFSTSVGERLTEGTYICFLVDPTSFSEYGNFISNSSTRNITFVTIFIY